MTAPTRTARRAPHPLVTVLGMVVVFVGIGYALMGVGFCVEWINHLIPGAKP